MCVSSLAGSTGRLRAKYSWKGLPTALTNAQIEKLLAPETPETPENLYEQTMRELAYASSLPLSESRNFRLPRLEFL